MNLLQRLNYILLPVITLVFSITGTLVYQVSTSNMRHTLVENWQARLAVVLKDIGQEQRTFLSSMSEVLNSKEMIGWISSDSAEFQAYHFESSLYTQINRVKKRSTDIETFQIVDQHGKLLISVDQGGPFSEPRLPAFPDNFIEPYLKRVLLGQSGGQRQELIYKSAAQNINLGLLQVFSPGLFVGDKFVDSAGTKYIALLTGKLNAIASLQTDLEKHIGQGYSLEFISNGSQVDKPDSTLGVTLENEGYFPIVLTLHDPLFQLRLELSEKAMAQEKSEQIKELAALMLMSITFCFLGLRVLIKREIVKPINELINNIELSKKGDGVQLTRLSTGGEVAHLNNAYLSLLEEVNREATHDPLTGMANRRHFQQQLGLLIERARLDHSSLVLIYIDLDDFKRVNDHFGHATGDRLLKAFGEQLEQLVRPFDTVFVHPLGQAAHETAARLGGDEFAILLNNIETQAAQSVAERIIKLFEHGFEVDGILHNVHASIGIAVYPEDGRDAETLLEHGDAAMYEAKTSGKNCYQFFSQEISTVMKVRRQIEQQLIDALDRETFELVYMPIFNATTLQPVGLEVLLRCPALQIASIGPEEFIPIAEAAGLMPIIDAWVIESSFKTLIRLQQDHGYQGFISINVSAIELHNIRFPELVKKLLDKYSVNSSLIELEITETSLAIHDQICLNILAQLKALGLSLALDDFGTGYMTFNQLQHYPVSCLKIDRSYVSKLNGVTLEEETTCSILLALAKLHKLRVVAEGVETIEQLNYLQGLGCEQVQGFYLSQPLSEAELENWLVICAKKRF